jgi:hypothetical protein
MLELIAGFDTALAARIIPVSGTRNGWNTAGTRLEQAREHCARRDRRANMDSGIHQAPPIRETRSAADRLSSITVSPMVG